MLKKIVKWFNYRKNSSILISMCSNYIDMYEADTLKKYILPSCKYDLMLEIRKRIENDKDGISKLNEHTNWDELVNANIYNASFDLLVSGEYHIYYGELNPMKCTRCLKIVCRSSLTWALDNHIITQETFDEQMKSLRVGISLAG